MEICDVVLFIKNECSMVSKNQYGIAHEIELSRDELTQKLAMKYRNSSKNIAYFTTCTAREVVLIYLVHEIYIMKELGNFLTRSTILSIDGYVVFVCSGV